MPELEYRVVGSRGWKAWHAWFRECRDRQIPFICLRTGPKNTALDIDLDPIYPALMTEETMDAIRELVRNYWVETGQTRGAWMTSSPSIIAARGLPTRFAAQLAQAVVIYLADLPRGPDAVAGVARKHWLGADA